MLVVAGTSVLIGAIATAAWRAVNLRAWTGMEAGLPRTIGVGAGLSVAVFLATGIWSAMRRPGWGSVTVGSIALVASTTLAVDVVQRAHRHGAPVVDVILPLGGVAGALSLLVGVGGLRRAGR